MTVGQRISTSSPAYVKHPAVANAPWHDGAALDAGTAHIVHNNVSHLSAHNARLIGHQIGHGATGFDTNTFQQWANVVDAYDQNGSNIYSQIPWYQVETAVVFGPHPLAFTRLQTDPPGYVPRKIRVIVEASQGTGDTAGLKICAAITTVPRTPLQAARIAEATETFPDPMSRTDRICDLVLEVTQPLRPSATWTARPTSGGNEASVVIVPAWVWVGYLSDDAAQGDIIQSISAFELRED